MDELITYGITGLFVVGVVIYYVQRIQRKSRETAAKVHQAKEEGRFIPVSLYPHIDPARCIGSGACIKACPESDILGLVNGRGTIINSTSCIGHGACFASCPTDAISLRIGTEERGVDLPHVKPNYETNVPGIFIAGELGGMGLIKNSMEQGMEAITSIHKQKRDGHPHPYDVAIVGGGPAGISASLKAKELGLSFITLDQDSLGGTVATYPRKKVVMTQPVNLPYHGKLHLRITSKDELIELWAGILNKTDIRVHEHHKVTQIDPVDGGFRLALDGHDDLHANQVLIATGRRGSPRKLEVPGEELHKVAYRLLDEEQIRDEDILVVGGGDSAVESALLLAPQNRVSLSYRKAHFARIKPGNQAALTQAVERGELTLILESNVTSIHEDHVMLDVAGKAQRIENERVYIFAGGELPTAFLRQAGILVETEYGKILKQHA